jgi:hypothetical protein
MAEPDPADPPESNVGVATAVTLSALGVIVLGLFPGPLLDAAEGALKLLIGG